MLVSQRFQAGIQTEDCFHKVKISCDIIELEWESLTQKIEHRSEIRFATFHYGPAGLGLVLFAVKHIWDMPFLCISPLLHASFILYEPLKSDPPLAPCKS